MTDRKEESVSARELDLSAPSAESEKERDRLVKAADELRQEMEGHCLAIRDLILAQPPVQLLGYVWAQFHMGVLGDLREQGDKYRPDKKLVENFQLVLEYLHAVWSCHNQLIDEKTPLDEAKATALFQKFDKLKTTTMMYCMASPDISR